MTKKQQEALYKIRDHIVYITETMQVNGDAGLEKILCTHHKRLNELYEVTEQLRSKKQLAKAIRLYLQNRPGLVAVVKFLGSKPMMRVWLVSLLSLLGLKILL